ncbi:CRISPR-associated endonuclease Cas2 [Atrimonas thermophila]|uniref:CRISPR-associated endonuclease Cas2 n=1 Tax=Atrimonas thermophila TaxID=3064161 RepID=UPI00399D53C6
MYVVMVYDVEEKRVNKVLKIGRKYLTWVQNSVLEGEITEARLERLKSELKRCISEEKDSVIFYIMRTTKYSERQILGVEKGGKGNFL